MILKIFAEVNARSLVCCRRPAGNEMQNAYGMDYLPGGLGLHYGGEKLRNGSGFRFRVE